MRLEPASILALACALTFGCSKPKPEEGKAAASVTAEPSSAPPVPKAAELPAEASTAAEPGARSVDGVGPVPAWARDHGTKTHCKPQDGADARIKALAKGADEGIGAGTADVAALTAELTSGCPSARRHMADALNTAGFVHYKKKDYTKANRFWRAALVARPAHALARFNLACGLALAGQREDAIWAIAELARAARDGDPGSNNLLEKAKSDSDLASVRADARFAEAVAAAAGGLVGPRKEPELAAAAVKLLPEEFRRVKDRTGEVGGPDGYVTYQPALLEFWTWRPAAGVELLVATLIDDPANLGQPIGDINMNYGGVVVLKRVAGGAPELLLARKTGESPPQIAGKGGAVTYAFSLPCGDLRGTLQWTDGKLAVKEQTCEELYR